MKLRIDWTVVAIAAAAGVICVLWTAWALHSPIIAGWWTRGADAASAGAWGDSFGAFNALFGALGFSAILGTLLLQGRALRHQQNDQHRQRFEASYFQLLGLLRQLRDEVSFAGATERDNAVRERTGLEAFGSMAREVQRLPFTDKPIGERVTHEDLLAWYESRVLPRHQGSLGPYFRVAYSILDRLRKDQVLTADEKADYGNLVRAQLTDEEMLLVGINGMSPISKDFQHLITEYRLLKYMPDGHPSRALEGFYPPETFLPREE